MNSKYRQIMLAVIIGVIINLVLPYIIKPFATPEQINPPNGAENLSYFDQLIHMFVHHAQVPLTSSVIIAIIVGISCRLSS